MRPAKDIRHINIVELDAVIKALNLATKWPAKRFVLHTDLRTVYGWLQRSLNNIRCLRTGGLQEVVVRRRVQIISDIVTTVGLQLDVRWVATADNIADTLTRIPGAWIQHQSSSADIVASAVTSTPALTLEEVLKN